jgi:hypothetical protein
VALRKEAMIDQEEEIKRLAVLRDWYESYSKTVSFVATIAAFLLIISATYVLKDTLTQPICAMI